METLQMTNVRVVHLLKLVTAKIDASQNGTYLMIIVIHILKLKPVSCAIE